MKIEYIPASHAIVEPCPLVSGKFSIKETLKVISRHQEKSFGGQSAEARSDAPSAPKEGKEQDHFNKLGEWLFKVAPDEVKRSLSDLSKDDFLRIVIHEEPDRPVESLPWEYLKLPGDSDFAAMKPNVSIVRSVCSLSDLRKKEKSRASQLRKAPLLAMLIGANPNSLPGDKEGGQESTIDLHKWFNLTFPEIRKKNYLVGSEIKPTFPKQSSFFPNDLGRMLLSRPRPTTLLLAAHGRGSAVYFTDEDGNYDPVNGTTIGLQIGRSGCVEVLSLCVCESGKREESYFGRQSLAGTISSTSGVPWIISCGVPLSVDTARVFFQHFFESIERGSDVERAVAIGRSSLLQNNDWSWGTLFLHVERPTSPAAIFRKPYTTKRRVLGILCAGVIAAVLLAIAYITIPFFGKKEVVIEVEGLASDTPVEVSLENAGAPYNNSRNIFAFSSVPIGASTIRAVSGEFCFLDFCPGPECPKWCGYAEKNVYVFPGDPEQKKKIEVPPPSQEGVALFQTILLDLPPDIIADGLLVESESNIALAGERRKGEPRFMFWNVPLGEHTFLLNIGNCNRISWGCSETHACPESCRSYETPITLDKSIALVSIDLSFDRLVRSTQRRDLVVVIDGVRTGWLADYSIAPDGSPSAASLYLASTRTFVFENLTPGDYNFSVAIGDCTDISSECLLLNICPPTCATHFENIRIPEGLGSYTHEITMKEPTDCRTSSKQVSVSQIRRWVSEDLAEAIHGVECSDLSTCPGEHSALLSQDPQVFLLMLEAANILCESYGGIATVYQLPFVWDGPNESDWELRCMGSVSPGRSCSRFAYRHRSGQIYFVNTLDFASQLSIDGVGFRCASSF